MEIHFDNDKLRKLCEKQTEAQKRLGQDCARKLKLRLADLAAADSVRELVAGRPHPLQRDRAGQFALDLAGGKRLVFEPAEDPVSRNPDKSIDWPNVTQVRIVFIGDYHD